MQIRVIEHGQIITEPGFYRMPMGWYHSDCCDGPSISSTGLRTIDLESPLHYWDKSYLNPNRANADDEAAEAKHFRMGRAGHALMLEPETFDDLYVSRPAIFKDWRTDAAKNWRAQKIADGFTVLSTEEMEDIRGIGKALSEHRWHTEGILAGVVETSLIVKDRKTGVWLKSRPDSIPLDNAFTDLKVMASAHPDAVERAIRNYGYDMQMALAGVCLELLEGRTIDQFWIVAVEAKRPHAIHVATLSNAQVYWARIRLRRSIDTFAECLKSGYWPSYGLDGQEVNPAPWEITRLERYQNSGLLPKEDVF